MVRGNDSYILRRLDDPWKLGLWELDIALPFSLCAFLGMLRGTGLSMFMGVALGYLLARSVSRIKAARHPAYIKHVMYWYLPPLFSRKKALPPSAHQEMVG
jgi:conjugal transfer pilus assembly protein TraL